MMSKRFATLSAVLLLAACADGTAPRAKPVNPYIGIGDMHNTLVAVAMRAAANAKATDTSAAGIESAGITAAAAFARAHPSYQHVGDYLHTGGAFAVGIQAAQARLAGQPTLLRPGNLVRADLIANSDGSLTSAQTDLLNQVSDALNNGYDISDVEYALDQIDANAANTLGPDQSQPVLLSSAIARASTEFWYAQAQQALEDASSGGPQPVQDRLVPSPKADGFVGPDGTYCGGFTNRCPINWRAVAHNDYMGAWAGLVPSTVTCGVETFGTCIVVATLGGAAGVSIGDILWQMVVGQDSGGGGYAGGGGAGGKCGTNEYATYERGVIVCKKYTL
jgi:hypothetical protein